MEESDDIDVNVTVRRSIWPWLIVCATIIIVATAVLVVVF